MKIFHKLESKSNAKANYSTIMLVHRNREFSVKDLKANITISMNV